MFWWNCTFEVNYKFDEQYDGKTSTGFNIYFWSHIEGFISWILYFQADALDYSTTAD